jgi:hypothetical protein
MKRATLRKKRPTTIPEACTRKDGKKKVKTEKDKMSEKEKQERRIWKGLGINRIRNKEQHGKENQNSNEKENI